jgi:hypothetical protein
MHNHDITPVHCAGLCCSSLCLTFFHTTFGLLVAAVSRARSGRFVVVDRVGHLNCVIVIKVNVVVERLAHRHTVRLTTRVRIGWCWVRVIIIVIIVVITIISCVLFYFWQIILPQRSIIAIKIRTTHLSHNSSHFVLFVNIAQHFRPKLQT